MIHHETNVVARILLMFFLMTCLGGTKGCYFDCCEHRLSDCRDYYNMGHKTSGVYHLTPYNMLTTYEVYCDMETDGGGWLVFQRRVNGSVDFNTGWDPYEQGFGEVWHEHWLGLALLKTLLHKDYSYELRIDLEDWEGNTKYAKYARFWINDYTDNYRLTVGMYTGTAGDALKYHSGQMFSTFDSDNDGQANKNCAATYNGGWWFSSCKQAYLNGKYYTTNPIPYDNGISWQVWLGYLYSLKHTEMKIRRL